MGLSIKNFVLNNANRVYFLPSIQRGYVWFDNRSDKKIEKLFDSLFQNYPIGNFLVWDISKKIEDSHLDFEVYEFIKDYNAENSENNIANLNGIQNLKLVLDGQQRLTSLFIGLKGSRTFKRHNRVITEKLYINLLSQIEKDQKNTYGLKYELEFLESEICVGKNSKDNELWFEIGKVMDFETEEDLKDFLDADIRKKTSDPEKIRNAKITLGTMHLVICTKDSCLVESVTDTKDNDKALDIFIRTNDGGTKLEKSEMLLSYMEASKDLFLPGRARKEVRKLLDELNLQKGKKPEYWFDKDFILKASLVLSDSPVQYRIKSFDKNNLEKISNKWGDIRKYLNITVELMGRSGFIFSRIKSTNALIPIAYYLMVLQTEKSIVDSQKIEDVKLKKEILKWFIVSTFKRMFGGSSDTTLNNARITINKSKSLIGVLEGSEITKTDITKIVENAKKGTPDTMLILMLVSDIKYWYEVDEDHIFPFSKMTDKEYLKAHGISDSDTEYYAEIVNSIGNIQLLSPLVNIKKSADNFLDWKNSLNADFLDSMLIPKIDDYSVKNFEIFVKERRELIIEKMCKILDVKEE